MTSLGAIPDDAELVRATEVFTVATTPPGLMRAHRVAADVWGRLVVVEGTVNFVFEDESDRPIVADADYPVVIPPGRPHHVAPAQGARFKVEFYR